MVNIYVLYYVTFNEINFKKQSVARSYPPFHGWNCRRLEITGDSLRAWVPQSSKQNWRIFLLCYCLLCTSTCKLPERWHINFRKGSCVLKPYYCRNCIVYHKRGRNCVNKESLSLKKSPHDWWQFTGKKIKTVNQCFSKLYN